MDVCRVYHDAYLRSTCQRTNNAVHLIGYHGDEPVTSSTLLVAGGIMGSDIHAAQSIVTLRLWFSYHRGHPSTWRAETRHVCCMASGHGPAYLPATGFQHHMDIPEYVWE
ncbi:MAG: hypothetical protein R2873_11070 [Caldilineaceae bacterium]